MKFAFQMVLIAGAMLAMTALLLYFGFSDWVGSTAEKLAVLQAKPWRLFARLSLAFILLSMTYVLGGALIQSRYRSR